MAIRFETDDHIALITIDRPEARNAVNGAVASGMEDALNRYEQSDDLWCAVLAANGPVFCAGADLKEIAAGNQHTLATPDGGFGGIVQRKRTKPLIAAVAGTAVAGGCEIALACDMIVAGDEAVFGLPEVKRSLVAVAGALIRLPRAVGMATAMEMLLTGEPITSERAHQLGLVNKVVPSADTVDAAKELARKIAENAPLAVQATRNLAARAYVEPENDLWIAGFEEFVRIMQSEDAKEGPRAFIEKRAPEWKAR